METIVKWVEFEDMRWATGPMRGWHKDESNASRNWNGGTKAFLYRKD